MSRSLFEINADLERLKAEKKAARIQAFAPGHIRSRSFRPEGEGQRRPRVYDGAHLAWIRRLPCVATYVTTGALIFGCQAAHLRLSSDAHGKPNPGGQRKPDDQWVTPLSAEQHRIQGDVKGETRFWSDLGINPFELCLALYAVTGDDVAGLAVIRALPRKHRKDLSDASRRP